MLVSTHKRIPTKGSITSNEIILALFPMFTLCSGFASASINVGPVVTVVARLVPFLPGAAHSLR